MYEKVALPHFVDMPLEKLNGVSLWLSTKGVRRHAEYGPMLLASDVCGYAVIESIEGFVVACGGRGDSARERPKMRRRWSWTSVAIKRA